MASPHPRSMEAAMPMRDKGWFEDRGIVKLNLILLISLLSGYTNGYDGSMMNGLQSLEQWKISFNNPGANDLALLNAIQHIGQLVGMPFTAWCCDRFGRKPTLIWSSFVMLLGVGLQAGATSTAMFVAARGILGFGLAFNWNAAPLLLMETAYPNQKSPLMGFFQAQWNSGAIVAAWTTFGTFRIANSWAWRIPSLLQALSSVIQILLCFLVKESPRWLIAQDRDDEAHAIMTKYHANGDPNDPVVELEMEEIREALRIDREDATNTSYLSFFKTKGNRLRFWIILAVGFFSQWSGNGLISYYLTLILNNIGYTQESTQTLINALLALWSLISTAFVAFFIVNRFPRRTLFLASTSGMLISYVVWTALQATYDKQLAEQGYADPALGKGVLAMIVLYNTSFNIGWTPLQGTYVIEILPYNLRARGIVMYSFFVAVALIFNQYVNPIALTEIKWKYYIVYDIWIFVEFCVIYFLFIETQGASMEEISTMIDGTNLKEKLKENEKKKVFNNENKEKTIETVQAKAQ